MVFSQLLFQPHQVATSGSYLNENSVKLSFKPPRHQARFFIICCLKKLFLSVTNAIMKAEPNYKPSH